MSRRLGRGAGSFALVTLVALTSLASCSKADKTASTSTTSSSAAPAVASASASASATTPQEAALQKQTKWIRSYVEAFDKHDADAIAALYTPDAVFVELDAQGGESKGTEAIKHDYKTIFEGFTDVKVSVTRSFHMGDVVALEFVEGGTGIAEDESEKRFGYVGASLLWFDENGKVKRDQSYYDDVTLEVQLGWAKPPLSKLEVRPVATVPPFTGTWEQHVATSATPTDEKAMIAVREKLYSKLLTPTAEKEFLEVVSDDIVLAEYDDPKDAVGKKAVGEVFRDWHKTFSNMSIEATHTWPCGEYVIFEGTFSGKHTGPWGPLKATNRAFNSHFLDVTRITKDGKVDRLWTYASSAEILGLRKGAK